MDTERIYRTLREMDRTLAALILTAATPKEGQ